MTSLGVRCCVVVMVRGMCCVRMVLCRWWRGVVVMMLSRDGDREGGLYDADSLQRELAVLEDRYGMSSAAFYAARERCETPADVSPFDRVVWADTYREAARLRTDAPDFANVRAADALG